MVGNEVTYLTEVIFYDSEGAMRHGIQRRQRQGWEVVSTEVVEQGWDASKTCCLGFLFLPLALLGKKSARHKVTYRIRNYSIQQIRSELISNAINQPFSDDLEAASKQLASIREDKSRLSEFYGTPNINQTINDLSSINKKLEIHVHNLQVEGIRQRLGSQSTNPPYSRDLKIIKPLLLKIRTDIASLIQDERDAATKVVLDELKDKESDLRKIYDELESARVISALKSLQISEPFSSDLGTLEKSIELVQSDISKIESAEIELLGTKPTLRELRKTKKNLLFHSYRIQRDSRFAGAKKSGSVWKQVKAYVGEIPTLLFTAYEINFTGETNNGKGISGLSRGKKIALAFAAISFTCCCAILLIPTSDGTSPSSLSATQQMETAVAVIIHSQQETAAAQLSPAVSLTPEIETASPASNTPSPTTIVPEYEIIYQVPNYRYDGGRAFYVLIQPVSFSSNAFKDEVRSILRDLVSQHGNSISIEIHDSQETLDLSYRQYGDLSLGRPLTQAELDQRATHLIATYDGNLETGFYNDTLAFFPGAFTSTPGIGQHVETIEFDASQ